MAGGRKNEILPWLHPLAAGRSGYRKISLFVHQLRCQYEYELAFSEKENNHDIESNNPLTLQTSIKAINKSFIYHDIVYSMTLEDSLTVLDPFTHTEQDGEKIKNFDFIREKTATERVTIVETFCTLVTVWGKYLEKNTFNKVLTKIDEIRKIIRIKSLEIYIEIYY